MSLKGRNAVITGGGRGIGKAIARYLAQEGASVVVSARSTNEIEQVAEELRADGFEAHAVTCDVSNEESVQLMADEARGLVGTVDIVVNNAGVAPSNPVKRLTLEEWNRVQSINVTGTFLCTKAFLQGMLDRQWGRVINIASVAGLRGSKYIAAYCASKHAQVGFTRALAAEVADQGITVNAICPGYVDTPMTDYSVVQISEKAGVSSEEARQHILAMSPQKRLIRPGEIAAVAVMLCRDDGEGISGQAIAIDQGQGNH